MTGNGKRCVVIGAGTVGSCCAWHLVQAGFQVTLVDRLMPGMGTSYGNAACLSPSHVVPFSHPGVWKKIPGWLFNELGPLTIRWKDLAHVAPWLYQFWRMGNQQQVLHSSRAQAELMKQVSQDFEDLLQAAGLKHFLKSKGLVVLYDRKEHFEADRWEYDLQQELGFDWGHLSNAELKSMAPAVDIKEGMAVFVPSWQHTLDPARMTAGIAQSACEAGAAFVNEEVMRVTANGSGVTVGVSSGREIDADHLVVAAGPWSNQLAAQLDYSVPMTPKRGYHSMISQPGIELDVPIMSGSRVFVMTPLNEGIRLAGTAEFARLDAPPNYKRARILQEHASYYLPDLQFKGVKEWMGQRPMMVDSIPVISPSPGHENVFYAFGHGHYGLTQAATTGKLIAAMVSGQQTETDMSPYRFDRFGNS